MPSIKVRENEPFDIALRRFRRSCDRAGVITDVRKLLQLREHIKRWPKTVFVVNACTK